MRWGRGGGGARKREGEKTRAGEKQALASEQANQPARAPHRHDLWAEMISTATSSRQIGPPAPNHYTCDLKLASTSIDRGATWKRHQHSLINHTEREKAYLCLLNKLICGARAEV